MKRLMLRLFLRFSRLPLVREAVKQLPVLERAAEQQLERKKDDDVYKKYEEYLES